MSLYKASNSNHNNSLNNKFQKTVSTRDSQFDETTIPESPRDLQPSLNARADILSDLLFRHTMEAPNREQTDSNFKKDGLYIRQKTAPGPKLSSPYLACARKTSLATQSPVKLDLAPKKSVLKNGINKHYTEAKQQPDLVLDLIEDSNDDNDDGFSFDCKQYFPSKSELSFDNGDGKKIQYSRYPEERQASKR